MRDAEAFAMYWHAEGMKSAYSGTLSFNGRQYTVTPERCYGYADKNWGRDFTTPWVWLSSNCLTSKKIGQQLRNSVFDIGGSRHHNRLWNGGNGWGTVKLYDREDGQLILTDEIEASHIGCEYGEYDHGESY